MKWHWWNTNKALQCNLGLNKLWWTSFSSYSHKEKFFRDEKCGWVLLQNIIIWTIISFILQLLFTLRSFLNLFIHQIFTLCKRRYWNGKCPTFSIDCMTKKHGMKKDINKTWIHCIICQCRELTNVAVLFKPAQHYLLSCLRAAAIQSIQRRTPFSD